LYPIYDSEFPGNSDLIARVKAEESFAEEYFNRTGVRWRHYYGSNGPRPPPVLAMWPADAVGIVHSVISNHGFWHCDGSAEECQSKDPVTIDIECVSTAPRAFIIDRFLSDFEADHIIGLATAKVKPSSVGNNDGGGVRSSNTRTSRNTWIPRKTTPITESITRRVADALRINESLLIPQKNSEDLQVVNYKVGQKYDSHHDWGVSGYPESRFITMLFYLNSLDEHAGGETSFPKGGEGGGFKVRPVKGSSVIFYDLLQDGNGDDLSLHAALPVIQGEKWLANYWIWDPKKH
jgi:prolyl 4-hydroxylase